MPIFEYACRNCSHNFEELVQGTQEPICPSCESRELEKKFSGFAVMGPGNALSACEELGSCPGCKDPQGAAACPFKAVD